MIFGFPLSHQLTNTKASPVLRTEYPHNIVNCLLRLLNVKINCKQRDEINKSLQYNPTPKLLNLACTHRHTKKTKTQTVPYEMHEHMKSTGDQPSCKCDKIKLLPHSTRNLNLTCKQHSRTGDYLMR